jgi:SAM-dependent methyltransferase
VSADFDRYRDSYEHAVQKSISFSGVSHEAVTIAKAEYLLELAERLLGPPAGLAALDVGCGAGVTDRHLVGRLGRLAGVDVSGELVERARAECPGVEYHHYEGERLPFPDGAFDLVFTICVVHHVAPSDRPRFFAELGRVTRPGGLVAVLEHNPLNPLTRLAVLRCPFDKDAELIGPGGVERLFREIGLHLAERAHILFFPWRSATLTRLERSLRRVPCGAQYAVTARKD